MALIFLNPQDLWHEYPWIVILGVLVLITLIVVLFRIQTVPPFILKFLKGGFGFSLVFFCLYLPREYIVPAFDSYWDQDIDRSDHIFVEVLEDDVNIYLQSNFDSEVLKSVSSGTLLLLTDVTKKGNLTWNKVLIGNKEFGWILRVMPAQIGIPETRKTIAYKFYFNYKYLYIFILSLLGFIWDYFKFRIKPI